MDFYARVLGIGIERFGVSDALPQGRLALRYGNQKINACAGRGTRSEGSSCGARRADLCFIAAVPLDEAIARQPARTLALLERFVRRAQTWRSTQVHTSRAR